MKVRQVFFKLKFMAIALLAMMLFNACGSDEYKEVFLTLNFNPDVWTATTGASPAKARPVWDRLVIEVYNYDTYDNEEGIETKRFDKHEFRRGSISSHSPDSMTVRIDVPINKGLSIRVQCFIFADVLVGYGNTRDQYGKLEVNGDDAMVSVMVGMSVTKEVRLNLDEGGSLLPRPRSSINNSINNISDNTRSIYVKTGETLGEYLGTTEPISPIGVFTQWEVETLIIGDNSIAVGAIYPNNLAVNNDIGLKAIFDTRPALDYTGGDLPDGELGEPYLDTGSTPVSVATATTSTGSSAGIRYVIAGGNSSLPPGLSAETNFETNGIIEGEPTTTGIFTFSVVASHPDYRNTPASFTIEVSAGKTLTLDDVSTANLTAIIGMPFELFIGVTQTGSVDLTDLEFIVTGLPASPNDWLSDTKEGNRLKISGTPPVGSSETITINVTARAESGVVISSPRNYTIMINDAGGGQQIEMSDIPAIIAGVAPGTYTKAFDGTDIFTGAPSTPFSGTVTLTNFSGYELNVVVSGIPTLSNPMIFDVGNNYDMTSTIASISIESIGGGTVTLEFDAGVEDALKDALAAVVYKAVINPRELTGADVAGASITKKGVFEKEHDSSNSTAGIIPTNPEITIAGGIVLTLNFNNNTQGQAIIATAIFSSSSVDTNIPITGLNFYAIITDPTDEPGTVAEQVAAIEAILGSNFTVSDDTTGLEIGQSQFHVITDWIIDHQDDFFIGTIIAP